VREGDGLHGAVGPVAGQARIPPIEGRAAGDSPVADEGEPVALDGPGHGRVLLGDGDAHPVEVAEEEGDLGPVVGAGPPAVDLGHALEAVAVDRGEAREAFHEVQRGAVEDDELHHADLQVHQAVGLAAQRGGDAPAVPAVDLPDPAAQVPSPRRQAHAPVPQGHLDHGELVRRRPDEHGHAREAALAQHGERVDAEEGPLHDGDQSRARQAQPRQAPGGQCPELLAGQAIVGEEGGEGPALGVEVQRHGDGPLPAGEDETVEQSGVVRIEGLVEGVLGAAAVTHEGDIPGVAAERPDMLVHPPQGGLLVEQGPIAARRPAVDDVQVPERPDAVGDGDHDDAPSGQVRAVVDRQRPRAAVPAVNEDEDGPGGAVQRSPDVDT